MASVLFFEALDFPRKIGVKSSATMSVACCLPFALHLLSPLHAAGVAAELGLLFTQSVVEFVVEGSLLDLVVFFDLLQLCETLAVSSVISVVCHALDGIGFVR